MNSTIDVRQMLNNIDALVNSLGMTVSYIEGCKLKHGETGEDADDYEVIITACKSIATDLKILGENSGSFRRYKQAIADLDDKQIEVFYRTKIDYQARLDLVFYTTSARQYLRDLTIMAFAVSGIHKPKTLLGVGSGLNERHKPTKQECA
ncbi:hypothetical protein D7027_05320 [Ochrobactrum intermedium]|uniref:hypothetical protein n=1 Tax=Brucella intermedia TaxID=94625 RepID=UPI00128E7303|nr:hypothetical protein [Brucella intermedia]MPR61240.1 hypothetical protein [Brucella intermedia]